MLTMIGWVSGGAMGGETAGENQLSTGKYALVHHFSEINPLIMNIITWYLFNTPLKDQFYISDCNALVFYRDDFEELQNAIDDSGMAVRFEHTPAGCSRGNQIAEDLARYAYQDSGMFFYN